MLVLSRKVGDSIQIGGEIKIRVSRISGSRVTLGIEAPESVRIVRGELKPIVEEFEVEMEQTQEATTKPKAPSKKKNRVRPSIPAKAPKTVTGTQRLSRLASSSIMAK